MNRHVAFDELDDALNRVYQQFQERYVAHPSGRVAVTARTHLPTSDMAILCEGKEGPALRGLMSLLPADVTLSVSTSARYDVFTITW